jgi:hypothetical protein
MAVVEVLPFVPVTPTVKRALDQSGGAGSCTRLRA